MERKQQVNPFAVGGAFVQYCVDHGILHLEMDHHEVKYFLTEQGEFILKQNFGIILSDCAKISK